MKELSIEWQIAAHDLLVKLASADDINTIYDLQADAKQLLKSAEVEYKAQS